jgi:hypothetical protein
VREFGAGLPETARIEGMGKLLEKDEKKRTR